MGCQIFHKLFILSFLSNGRAHLARKNKTSQISKVYGSLSKQENVQVELNTNVSVLSNGFNFLHDSNDNFKVSRCFSSIHKACIGQIAF